MLRIELKKRPEGRERKTGVEMYRGEKGKKKRNH
jgi:hypothetical protein